MRILLATSNPHKRDEILAIFEACGAHGTIELITLAELGNAARNISEPVEDGQTFEANAIKKACHYAQATGMRCLADDSGLEVDALDGEPGVYSARYSGVTGDRADVDLANNRLLLEKLADTPTDQRTARFVCAMALCDAEGRDPIVVRGTVEGRIIHPHEAAAPQHPERGRGQNGFGYDPLFILPDHNRTSAELTPDQKNAVSHRGDASRKMWERLQAML